MEKKYAMFGKRFLAMILALAIVVGVLPAYGSAAERQTVSAMTEKVADPDTVNTYRDLLGAFTDGNRYAGRLWTDKSVFDNHDTLADALGGELSAEQLAQLSFTPEEFLVLYSALGSTSSVATQMTVSSDMDVVIVLDNSGSMRSTVTNANDQRVTRLQAVVDAANMLISGILQNPSNRLSLVAYSADASLLLDLDNYGQTDTCLTNSGGKLSAAADSLTDSSSKLQGHSITANQSGTNVQSGINEAMKILYNAENTEGRTPVVIVMTDGAANYAAYQDMLGDTSGDGNYKQPSSSNTTADIALSTLLNAAYWKYMLDVKYNTETVVYTVGVDVEELADASLVLDPGAFFNAASTNGFSSVALGMLELYTEWSESNSAITGATIGRGNSRYTWTFPQPATEEIKTGIENHIVYSDKYYEVNSVDLESVFDDILTNISTKQDAFQAIEKSDIINGESSMVYVDFIGDYMQLQDFKGISLYGQLYNVTLKSTVTNANNDGTVTKVYTYGVVDNGKTIVDPFTGEAFLLSENVRIELKHTYAVDAQDNRISAGEQDLWIHIDERVLPLVYHKVEDNNGVTTYTVYEQLPVRFYYTVGISDYVAPAGNVLLHRIDQAYLDANTVDGVVRFYANQYFAQDDDETLVNHTQASGYGDTHTAITPSEANRYYIHQYNYPVYTQIVDAQGNAVVADPFTYGVPYDSSYVTTIMTYADVANLNESTRLYSDVKFHAPTGNLQQTTTDGGKVYSGETKHYYAFADWGHLLDDVIFYDTVNGVYVLADGTTCARGVWNENYTYEQYLETVASYLRTNGLKAEDLQAHMAIGSWRVARFANRTFAKTENRTGTASLRIAPVRDSDDETDHEGSIVVWLGNNGRIGYKAQELKTVTDANGNDIDGQLVVIGDELTYTITATNYEDRAATIVITDTVPAGTAYVDGSADNGATLDGGKLTWVLENVPMGESVTVTYKVRVTGENMAVIENTAYIRIGNNPAFETNTTKNPPIGKTSQTSGQTPEGQVKVGDVLTYTIYYHNNTDATAKVVVIDTVPAGTTYVENSASYHGTDALQLTEENGKVTLTWTIAEVPAGQSGSVHFQVRVNADAVNPIDNAAEIIVGDNGPVILTNKVSNELAFGNLELHKIVADGNAAGSQDRYFTLQLQSAIEGVSALNGTYAVSGSSAHTSVTFVDGAASLQIKHGETIKIQGLPAGVTITVYEEDAPGYSAVYSADFVNIVAGQTARVDITNIYNVTPTSVVLTGKKNFTGMNLEDGMFTFLVYDEQGNVVVGGSNAADGTITFSEIHFAAAGTYTYTVKESNTGAKGVNYDTTVYTVTVTVTDDGNGNLTASVAYPQGGLVFTNTYSPDEVKVDLAGEKNLNGEAADGIAAGEYSFDVYTYDITTGKIGQLISAGTTVAGERGAVINFAPLGFTLADMNGQTEKTFYFLVEEDVPAENGPTYDPNMLYDRTQYLVEIRVTYNAETGILTAGAPVYSILGGADVEKMTFTNIQNPDSVEVTPIGTKTTTNAPSNDLSFSFSVFDASGEEVGVGVGPANGQITFTSLRFTQPGTYTYTIRESNAGTMGGITYDSTVYTMTVVVTRDATNKLVATVSYPDGEPAFTNIYSAKGHINLTANKVLNGRDLNGNEFAFRLVRQDNGEEIDGIADANGLIRFATMYYDLEDLRGEKSATIHYVMTEVNTHLPGVTYDAAKHDVYVTIVNNGDGTISAFLSDANGNALSSVTDTGITFTNTYRVTTGADVTMEVQKVLTGRPLKDGEFTFALYRLDGANGWKNVASAVNVGHTVSFTRHYNAATLDNLAFDGSYTVLYRIDEINNHLAGVNYDTKSIYVKVVIHHDEQNASYSAEIVGYYSDEACQNELTEPKFTNVYATTSTTLAPVANKVLEGRPLNKGEFSFVVKDTSGNVVSYGTNDAAGNVTFNAITFEKPGTYTFTMEEVRGDLGGVSYDSASYTFTVTVVDNGNGTLTATAAYPNGGITFRNNYNAKPVTVQPSAMKVLDGKNLQTGEFTFVLKDVNGNVIETAANNANGNVMFSQITYTQPGVYKYTISEQKGEDNRYTYSETVYEITVTVTDDGKGSLYAHYHILREGVEVGAVTFYNKFTPAAISLDLNSELTFHKTVEDPAGTGMTAAGFTFYVYNWNGELVSSAISDAKGNIDFEPDLVFTAAGEYHFRVVEKAENVNGVTYDDTVWVVTVTVAYNADTGVLSISDVSYTKESGSGRIQGNDLIEFVNTYAPEKTQATISLKKELEGRELVAGEFIFQLWNGDKLVAETTNDAKGNVTFHLTFDQVGEYNYTVVELAGKQGGVSFDGSVKYVTIRVTDTNTDGELEAEVVIANGDDTFENKYQAGDATMTLTARKLLDGRNMLAGEFTFLLIDANGNEVKATNDANGVINFGTITYTEAGIYTYTIREQNDGLGGVTYSGRVFTATVTVTDDLNGKLVATVVYTYQDSNGVTQTIPEPLFHNVYVAADGALTLTATKILYGRQLQAGEFTFVLTDADGNVVEVTNKADGTIDFGTITYTETGVYTYTITEKSGDLGGVTYSDLVYTVTVTVTDNGEGKLVADAVYTCDEQTVESIVFTNVYAAATAQINLEAFKILEGRVLRADEFRFVVTDAKGNLVVSTNEADGTVDFGTFYYETAGVYTYTIHEEAGILGGVEYCNLIYTVTVTVTDNGAGQLIASAAYSLNGQRVQKAVFTNAYATTGCQINLGAFKILEGRVLRADEFRFVLTDAQGNLVVSTNEADGTVDFGTFQYDAAGTYTYSIHEEAGELGGVGYSNLVYIVTVTVTDNGAGQLVARVTYSLNGEQVNRAVFTNTYSATGTNISLQAHKVLEGRTLQAGEFAFLLTDESGNTWEAVNTADGNVRFDTIHYTLAGTYTYTIREKAGELGGVTYSDLVYTVIVTVTDNGNGQLIASAIYERDGQQVDQAIFTNSYKAAAGQITLEAFKALEGRMLKADEFTFVLTDANGNIIEATNEADGTVDFGAITYTEAGTYTYSITEEAGILGGVTYSDLVYIVTVTVTDNGRGQLVAEAVYTCNGETVETALFTNVYQAAAVDVALEAHKELRGRMLKAGEFTFVLTDANGNIIEATNAADGTVDFGTITFAEAGIYTYTITEEAGELGGVTYCDLVYIVTVTVTDNGRGQLEAEVVYSCNDNAVESVRFTNTYKAADTQITLGAFKTLEGRMLKAGEFTFLLTDKDGNVIEATNAADGTIDFGTITYTASGVYTYTITEQAGELGGVTYSDLVYTVTVTVTDNGEGQLIAEAVYGCYGEEVEAVVFTNAYAAEPVQIALEAQKVLDGRMLKAGEFTFLLTDENGNVVEVTNAADGTIDFGTITYTEAGTYTYTITEQAGELGGVTYSDLVYTVTVTVTDNGEGQLLADVVYTCNGEAVEAVVFTNTYAAEPVQVALEAFKILEGRMLKADEFTFLLTDADGNIIEATNAADGTIDFGTITYTEAGTYTYSITEQAGELGGVTYCDLVYIVTVTVTDNGAGQLEAEVVYQLNDEAVEEAVFVNGYQAGALTVALEATKSLVGMDLVEGAFTFVLTDESGNTIEATNTADGTIRFADLVFTAEGIYQYALSEVAGEEVAMAYDENVYSILISVVDNGEGALVIDTVLVNEENVTVTNGVIATGVTFVNVYDPIPETGDQATFLAMLLMSSSILALAVLLLAEKNRRTNG